MFKPTPSNLRDNIRLDTEFRDEHLEAVDKLVTRYHGRFYRRDDEEDSQVVENHAFQYVSIIGPSLIYDSPTVDVTSFNPLQLDQTGTTTHGDFAQGLELMLNRWARDVELNHTLILLSIDYMFSYGVAMVTQEDQPGYFGAELVPQRPVVVRIPQRLFVMDRRAKQCDPMLAHGPRYQGHVWVCDKDDLADDPEFDRQAVEALVSDSDLDKYTGKNSGANRGPTRDEVVGIDLWIPELNLTDEPGFNGSIHTVAYGSTPDGDTKRSYEIRAPRPAYCGPWGPYVMFGAYPVPNSPYPLGPIAAVAEQAEEVNAHAAQAAEDAGSRKRFGISQDAGDQERIKTVRNGEVILLNEPDKFKEVELGGNSDKQLTYTDIARQTLNRNSGLSDTVRGDVQKGTTATGEAIADKGSTARMAGLKRGFRDPVRRIYRGAAWVAVHGDDVVYRLGQEGMRKNVIQFEGGLYPDRQNFSFFDLGLEIDETSMEHTDQGVLQRNLSEAFGLMLQSAPLMQQIPYVHWREWVRRLFEPYNIKSTDEMFDFAMLQQGQDRYSAEQAVVQQLKAGQGLLNGVQQQPMQSNPAIQPAMQNAQQIGNMHGQAVAV